MLPGDGKVDRQIQLLVGGTLTIKITAGRREPSRGAKEHESTRTNTGKFRKFLVAAGNCRGHRLGRGLGKVLSEN